MHKSQLFFYLLSAFLVGVFIASIFNVSQSIIYIILIVCIGLVVLLSFKNKFYLLVALIFIAFIVGIIRFNQLSYRQSSLAELAGSEVSLTGYINSQPEIDGSRQKFVFKTNGEQILVTTNAYPRYAFGDKFKIIGELELPKNFDESFDYITYLKKEGIRFVMSFPDIEKNNSRLNISFSERIKLFAWSKIFSVKEKFEKSVGLSIPEPNASFINGILLGSRQNIPDDLKEAFNKTGTTHILAISGYNIMIISWAVLMGLIFFFKRRPAFWLSVAVIIMFVILTGASASVVRAAIMGLILSFAHGYGRLYDQRNSIILAGGIMVFHNPFTLVFDIGFQLSFAAVLGIIYLYPIIDRKLKQVPKAGGFKEILLMTLSAQITVAPLLIYYFGGFSPLSLPTNVLILPFVPAAMFFGFLAGIGGMLFAPLGQIIGYAAWAVTTYQIEVVKFFAGV